MPLLCNRAELDAGRHDPWSAEFVDLFNDQRFRPVYPEGYNGVTDDILFSFDPCFHPHKRPGTLLKQRWNKLRSGYTVAREKVSRTGQGEHDSFDLFTDGYETLSYMHCVFYNQPSLEAIVRSLPEGAGIETGLHEIENARETSENERPKKKKKETADTAIKEGLLGVAKSLSAPIQISFKEQKEKEWSSSNLHAFDVTDRIASTVKNLMELEASIYDKIKEARKDGDSNFVGVLEKRAEKVRLRIDESLLAE